MRKKEKMKKKGMRKTSEKIRDERLERYRYLKDCDQTTSRSTVQFYYLLI